MTTKLEQAARQALEALEQNTYYNFDDDIKALREALAEPDMNLSCKSVQARLATSWGYVKAEQAEQRIPSHVHIIKQIEIVPEQDQVHVENIYKRGNKYFAWIGGDYVQIYTAPVRTKDLTDAELDALWYGNTEGGWRGLFRAVIAADREKNNVK